MKYRQDIQRTHIARKSKEDRKNCPRIIRPRIVQRICWRICNENFKYTGGEKANVILNNLYNILHQDRWQGFEISGRERFEYPWVPV